MLSLKNILLQSIVLCIGFIAGAYFSYISLSGDKISCPVASKWGNCFDGLAILVGVLNAAAVVYLSWHANKIALSGRNEQRDRDFREGRILLSYVVPELRDARLQFAVVQHLIEQDTHRGGFAINKNVRVQISNLITNIHLPQTKEILPRMHVMPDKVGSSLAQLLGVVRSVGEVAKNAASRETPGAVQDMYGDFKEPTQVTDQALLEFSADYGVIKSATSLALGEIDRLFEAETILQSI